MLILPQTITEYISTNLAQPYQLWNELTTYQADQAVLYKNYIYKCITNDNTGIEPSLNTGKWLLMGVDNAYAGIDLNSSTATQLDEGLTFIECTFSATGNDSLAFGRIYGTTLTVEQYDIGDVLLDSTDYPITGETAIDAFTNALEPTVDYITIRVTQATDGNAYFASMVCGMSEDIGATEYNVNIDIIDYSVKTTDTFGITTLQRRRSREVMEVDIVSDSIDTQLHKRQIKAVLGTALMFIADPSIDSKYDSLIILGYVDRYQMYIDNGVKSRARMKILEVL